MTPDFVDLGQALCFLKAPSRPFVDPASSRAILNAKIIPKDRALREKLINALVQGELAHTAALSVMDRRYNVNERGQPTRGEYEALAVEPAYQIPASFWHIDNVDFVLSGLDLDEWVDGYGLSRAAFEDEPWMRATDILVSTNGLIKIAGQPGSVTLTATTGRRPNMAFWHAFYIELVCDFIYEGKPIDDDAEWAVLLKKLRVKFTDVDESQIEKALRVLRNELRAKGYLRSPI